MISTRPKSPTRTEAISRALKNEPYYGEGVLIGNWVENRIECLKDPHLTLHFPPEEKIDYNKMKPEFRAGDLAANKLAAYEGSVQYVLKHDSHINCKNFATTSDIVFKHLPKPLCGPDMRYYKKAEHQFYPQPDLMKCFGNITEWGLRNYKFYEWACTDVSDYASTLYEDTFVAPMLSQYVNNKERKARDSSFTKTFRFLMTKPLAKPKKKSK